MTTVLHNGRVFIAAEGATPDHFVSAVVFDAATGTITHVGADTDDAVMQARSAPGAAVHDVRGRVVLPGFVDGHMHLSLTGESLQKLDVRRCKDLGEIQAAIRAYAAAHPELDRIQCRGWFHPSTDGNELATQLDGLDVEGKDRPVYIDADDLHSAWLNTAALEEIGAADMQDPTGGEIRRGEDGRPSGIMSETAAVGIVWPFLGGLASEEHRLRFVGDALDAYLASGYTGVVEMAMNEGDWATIQRYRARQHGGELPLWLAAHWFVFPRETPEETLAQVDRAIALQTEYSKTTSPRCRIAGIKVMCDGVVDACTAALHDPYTHSNDNAAPTWTFETLAPVLKKADAAGLQCALHAIGDAAITLAIDALEAVGNPSGRHRIEHLETCRPEDVPRLGALGITASVQPVHLDPAGLQSWEKLLGPSRCGHVFPYSAFATHGAPLALGSDAPTAPFDPLPNLYLATTRNTR
ncbi:hypothetical protein PWT90_09661 [Aphanocladium album]|nr:hypothetical protein PWT90_09661 [Aphanocladium album]